MTGTLNIDSLDSRSDFDIKKSDNKRYKYSKLDAVSPKKDFAIFKFDINIKADESIK